ncbi:TonB-dependent receptor [Sphingobacterium siyangense]|jgi:outer membrane cobalamin receptor|uniref:TonB-dependent receptor n=1 Tax=Sphingobacterium siyangense TaxID=459529 RepID=UPI0028AB09C8|nr:TonB-dependent receptor [Sphingobacterium siyangense]
MSKFKVIWLLLFLTLSFPSFSQQLAQIEGSIKNSAKEAIEGATILQKGTNKGAKANRTGSFILKHIPFGNHEFIISALGYKTLTLKLEVNKSTEILKEITLSTESNSLDEVQVEGKTVSKRIKESGFNVNVIETKQYANTNSDINQILNRSTGVKIREQGGLGSRYSFSLNGLSGNNIKFFIDGVPIESFGSGMSLNNMPVNIAERIEVYKGVVPAHLGSDALGGAINIVTNRDYKKSLDVSYSIGSFNTHRAAVSAGYKHPKNGLMINLNSYYNFSNNNYLMRTNPKAGVYLKAPIPPKNELFDTLQSARRFHDDYRSFMTQVEVGISNKKWADIAVLGLTYNDVYDQQQTAATQERVLGHVFSKSHTFTPSLRYRKDKFLFENLSATVYANYSRGENIITDTSSRTYYFWNGIATEYSPNAGELNSYKSITHQKINNSFSQANLNYKLSASHLFNFNYNLNTNKRENYNEIDPYNDFYNITNQIYRTTIGLNYQQILWKERLNNSFFIKEYGLSGKTNTAGKTSKNYFGYGAVTNIKLDASYGIKLSYEHAYQLPTFTELFGDGLNVMANEKLKPANSDNYNLNFYYGTTFGNHYLNVDASTYYRNVKDYIIQKSYDTPQGQKQLADNEGGVKVNGVDFEVKYGYKSNFMAVLNMSYYNAVDREKYDKNNREKITYKNRTPNEPWLFGNLDISYGRNNLFSSKDNRIQLNYYLQFVNNYSLSWSKLAEKSTKDYIPAQWLHNIAATYSFNNNTYNITVEGKNLTDQIAYDIFKQQRPGRSVYLKLRYLIRSSH